MCKTHIRVLRAFSSWLQRDGFTDENILAKLRVPKAPKKVLKTLSEQEIGQLFVSLDQNTVGGCRDAAMLLLFLDTGLRSSELLHLAEHDLHLADQWLKVLGKGQKERLFLLETKPQSCSNDTSTISGPSRCLTINSSCALMARQ